MHGHLRLTPRRSTHRSLRSRLTPLRGGAQLENVGQLKTDGKIHRHLFGVVAAAATSSVRSDPCEPHNKLLANPYVKKIDTCVFSLSRTLNDEKQRAFAEKLVKRALSDTKHRNSQGPGMPLDYVRLAELAALLNTTEVIDAFLAFISKPADDEVRTFAIGRLYELRTPLVLDRLALLPKKDQDTINESIAWGLTNNFHLFMNLDNYRRLAVGANWEVLDPKHPHRELSERIEQKLRSMLIEQPS